MSAVHSTPEAVENTIARKIILQKEVETSLEEIKNKFGAQIDFIIEGLRLAKKQFADKKKECLFEKEECPAPWDQHDMSEWTPLKITLTKCFEDLKNAIEGKRLPELLCTGREPTGGIGTDDYRETTFSVYNNFRSLFDSVKKHFHSDITLFANSLASKANAEEPIDDKIIATFGLLLGIDGKKAFGFIQELEESADWKAIDSKLHEIELLTKELPTELRHASTSTQDLRAKALEILQRNGLRQNPEGRSPAAE